MLEYPFVVRFNWCFHAWQSVLIDAHQSIIIFGHRETVVLGGNLDDDRCVRTFAVVKNGDDLRHNRDPKVQPLRARKGCTLSSWRRKKARGRPPD
jgi:hypothetical protein